MQVPPWVRFEPRSKVGCFDQAGFDCQGAVYEWMAHLRLPPLRHCGSQTVSPWRRQQQQRLSVGKRWHFGPRVLGDTQDTVLGQPKQDSTRKNCLNIEKTLSPFSAFATGCLFQQISQCETGPQAGLRTEWNGRGQGSLQYPRAGSHFHGQWGTDCFPGGNQMKWLKVQWGC